VLLASGKTGAALQDFLNDVLAVSRFSATTAPLLSSMQSYFAHVRSQERPRGAHDLVIAATARAGSRTIVSADDSAFEDLPGVQVRMQR
jgi:tRNA(fMet)-specific endonuclease VapC